MTEQMNKKLKENNTTQLDMYIELYRFLNSELEKNVRMLESDDVSVEMKEYWAKQSLMLEWSVDLLRGLIKFEFN